MSLAVGPRKGKASYLYAGVNSSPADIAKGKNLHLRTIAIEQSKSRASVGTKIPDVRVAEVSRSALFTEPDAATYQRLLRVAGPMAAAATAMGKQSQLAVFEATVPNPKIKGVVELAKDAEDLDIIQTGDNEFQVAFCHKYELHLVNIGKQGSDAELVFTMPDEHGERPVFRSIRYLSPSFILAAANLPKRSGVLIQGFRLPTPGHPNARIAATVRIPGKINATALAVANISPPASPTAPLGDTQFIIAVAGSDSSISLYTMTHQTATTIDLLMDLNSLYTLKDVHGDGNITGLAFSHFVTPKTHIRPQFIKLASISLQKTVAVHSIPLKKQVDRTPRNRKGPPRPVRYVVGMKSKSLTSRPPLIVITIMVLIMAIIGQAVMEIYGKSPPIVHVHKIFPSWHGTLRTFDPQPDVFLKDDFLARIAGDKKPAAGESLVMWQAEHPDEAQPNSINVDVHDEEVHGPVKEWKELGDEQKEAWKEKLYEAGAWTQDMGESVFKGVLFGEMAGAVGRAMAG